jgi:hypothetical protein
MAVRIDEETIEQTLRIIHGYIKDNSNQLDALQNSWKAPFTLLKQAKLIRLQGKLIKKLDWIGNKRDLNIRDLQSEIEKLKNKEFSND